MLNNVQSKYKILTIIYDLDIGGTQRAAQNFAMAYHRDGHDSQVLPIYNGGVRKNELEQQGIKVYPHGKDLEESIRLINQWQPDIIHIHRWGDTDPYLSQILNSLKNSQTKVIETNVFSFVDNSLNSNLIDVHCHLSEWCLWKWNIFLKKKSLGIVIPYLVVADNFYKETNEKIVAYKERLGLPKDKFIFGRIGQRSPAKFNKEIYLAFDRLYSLKNDTHLFLVGLPPYLLKEVELLSSFKQGAITLVDCIQGDEELRLAYNSMNCFLHFSAIGESFGMVLAEAELCQVPVISVSTPKRDNTQLEVLVHEQSSIIVKNEKYLFEIMQRMIVGYYPLEKFGKRGREHILSMYSPQVIVPKLNLLFKLLKERKDLRQFRQEISKNFKSNLSPILIKHLQRQGFGAYSLSNKIFFLMPKYYLKLSEYIYRLRKKLWI